MTREILSYSRISRILVVILRWNICTWFPSSSGEVDWCEYRNYLTGSPLPSGQLVLGLSRVGVHLTLALNWNGVDQDKSSSKMPYRLVKKVTECSTIKSKPAAIKYIRVNEASHRPTVIIKAAACELPPSIAHHIPDFCSIRFQSSHRYHITFRGQLFVLWESKVHIIFCTEPVRVGSRAVFGPRAVDCPGLVCYCAG